MPTGQEQKARQRLAEAGAGGLLDAFSASILGATRTDTWMSRAVADGRGLPGQGCPPRAGDETLEGGVDRGRQKAGSGEQTVLGAPWAVGGRLAGWPLTPLRPQSADSIPPGYEPVSLLEALNGLRAVPPAIPPAVPTAPLYEEITYSGVSDGLSQASCPLAGIDRMVESSLQKGKPRNKSPDR